MAAMVRSASTEPTFSDQSHLHTPTQGFPGRMGRGRSGSESRLSLPRSDSVFSLSRMRPPSAASSSGTVATHSRRQIYTVDREALLAKAGIRPQGTPVPPTPLRLVNKTRRIVGTISVADLMVIAKGVPITGLQQARSSSRAQSVASAPHYMANDASYRREQRYSSLGALQSLGKTPWDILGLSNEDFQSSKADRGTDLNQFLRQQSSPTSEWATGLKGKATKGRFAAGSHGCLNLAKGMVRSGSMDRNHARSLDNVHFLEYNPSQRVDDKSATSPFSPPSQRRGVMHQDEEDVLAIISPPTSRKSHRDDPDDADDEEDWLSLLSPSAAKSLRALDEAERPYAAHRRRKSRRHREQDEEDSATSGSPPPQRKHQRLKRSSDAMMPSQSSLSPDEDMMKHDNGQFSPPTPMTPESPRRKPVLNPNGNLSPLQMSKFDLKRPAGFARSSSLPSPTTADKSLGKLSPLESPQLQRKWATKSNLSPLISPEFGRKLSGGLGLFDRPPSPLGSHLGFSPILKRGGGTPPSPRRSTPVKQRRVKLKNVDAKWPAPLSPDNLRKQMMETESAETETIAEEVINPDFEVMLNLLTSESTRMLPPVNQNSLVVDLPERQKSPSPTILVHELDFHGSDQELKSSSEQIDMDISVESERPAENYGSIALERLSPIPKSGSKSPSPVSAASQTRRELPRPPSPFSHEARKSPSPQAPLNVKQHSPPSSFKYQPTQAESQENLAKDFYAEGQKVFSDFKVTDEDKYEKEDWISLLSPTGARSLRALSEAERPYASFTPKSKEELSYPVDYETVNGQPVWNQRNSRSPSPYSTSSNQMRPILPPPPLILQNRQSKSSIPDFMPKYENVIQRRSSDVENDTIHMNARNAPYRRDAHSHSQYSLGSETSFESYELTPPKQLASRSPSISSSLFGKRERPARPPLPLVLQARNSSSRDLNLNLLEYHERDKNVESVRNASQLNSNSPYREVMTAQSEYTIPSFESTGMQNSHSPSPYFISSELQRSASQNEPAVIPCELTEKRISRSPSPYHTSLELRRSTSQNELAITPRELTEKHTSRSPSPYHTSSALRRGTSQNKPAVIQSKFTEKHSSHSPSPHHTSYELQRDRYQNETGIISHELTEKRRARSPSPYFKSAELRRHKPDNFSNEPSPHKSPSGLSLLSPVLQKPESRSPSPNSKAAELKEEMPSRLSRGPSSTALHPEKLLLDETPQKRDSHSPSPYSKAVGAVRRLSRRLSREFSSREFNFGRSSLLNLQKSGSLSDVPCSREPRKKAGKKEKSRGDYHVDLPIDQSLICDITQNLDARSASPQSRASDRKIETPTQEGSASDLLPEQTLLDDGRQKKTSRSTSPYSNVSGRRGSILLDKISSVPIFNKLRRSRSASQANVSVTHTSSDKVQSTKDASEHSEKIEILNLGNEASARVSGFKDTQAKNTATELQDLAQSVSGTSEDGKFIRPSRPSPPPPLSTYRRSPVLLSSILPAATSGPQQPQNATEEEESISHSYWFHDLYTTAGQQKTDRVTYTKDDIKAILRGEKPLRPPPPERIIRRASSVSSLGGNQNETNDSEHVAGVASTGEEVHSNEVEEKKADEKDNITVSALADIEQPAITEVAHDTTVEMELLPNVTSTTDECQRSQVRPLVASDTGPGPDQVHQPPPPQRLQRRRSSVSLSINKKEQEVTVTSTTQAQVLHDNSKDEVAGEVTLSQSYLYDVYATAGSRQSNRVTYTKDDIKAILTGEKPLRPPPPPPFHKTIPLESSLENPKEENENSSVIDNATDVVSPTDDNTQRKGSVTGNNQRKGSVTDNTQRKGSFTDNSRRKGSVADNTATSKPTRSQSPIIEVKNENNSVLISESDRNVAESRSIKIEPKNVPPAESDLKGAAPKRPSRPPPPAVFVPKSATTTKIPPLKGKAPTNATTVKDKAAPNVNPQGSRSPSPMAFQSVRGIGNTKLPMRPPLPVNILVQQWLDKQCKPN